jgi:beta-lactamase regulating signal transducer with metallopeptidase domain/lipopolysaccharide biosynthesis regulator YciM
MTSHLLACTFAAVVAILAATALRRRGAAWRHAILLVALLRFAVPTEWFSRAGASLVRHVPVAIPNLANSYLLLRPAEWPPFMGSHPASSNAHGLTWLWLAGTAASLFLWLWRVWPRIPAVRQPNPGETATLQEASLRLGFTRPVVLQIVEGTRAPGALGILHPRVILPEGLSAELSAAELTAVLAHELAHLRRRDNLWAALAHLVASVFWFHPLVWFLERRLLAERETACDELVLLHGTQPEAYLAGILKVCRMAFAGAAGYAGVNGSNLQKRVEYILSVNLSRRSSTWLRATLGTAVGVAVLMPLAVGFLNAQQSLPASQRKLLPPNYADPQSPADVLVQSGMEWMAKNQYQKAEEAFRKALELAPNNFRALQGLVASLRGQGRTGEALAMLQDETVQPTNRGARQLALGNTALLAGEYDLAIAVFRKILEGMDADSKAAGDIFLRLGETYRRKGDMPSAAAALRRARTLRPGDGIVLNVLALVLDRSGLRDEAQAVYREALAAAPDNAVVLNNLAFLLAQSGGDLDEALAFAQRAKELVPNLTEVSDTLGWIYLKKNLPDQAVAVFNDLVKQEPSRSTFHYHLGMALAQKGDRFMAVEQLLVALRSNPSPEEQEKIQQLLDRLQ